MKNPTPQFDSKFALLDGIEPAGTEQFVPVDQGELDEIETTVGAGLPAVYRDFLTSYGASMFGQTHATTIADLPKWLGNGYVWFGEFFGSRKSNSRSVVQAIHTYLGRMPPNVIPIADAAGDKICMVVSGERYGQIYYWDHNNEPPDEEDYLEDYGEPMPPEAMWSDLHLVARSFSDLIQRLERVP